MCMALDATDMLEVAHLIWKPVMFGDNIWFFLIADQLKLVDIVMATQADVVVISDYFIDDRIISGVYLISMRFVTSPTGKVIGMFSGMYAQCKFSLNFFKLEFGIFFISPVAIDAVHFWFHSNFR